MPMDRLPRFNSRCNKCGLNNSWDHNRRPCRVEQVCLALASQQWQMVGCHHNNQCHFHSSNILSLSLLDQLHPAWTMEVFQWEQCRAQAKPLAISCGSDRDVFHVNKNIMDSYKSCTFGYSLNTDYLKLAIFAFWGKDHPIKLSLVKTLFSSWDLSIVKTAYTYVHSSSFIVLMSDSKNRSSSLEREYTVQLLGWISNVVSHCKNFQEVEMEIKEVNLICFRY